MEKRVVPELKFYKVDKKFLAFLHSEDEKRNGFSCVPTMNYSAAQKEKFMCGIVLKVGDFNYFAPVSSYTKKQKDNILLFDSENNVTSSIRLNFMFPAPEGVCKIYNFEQEVDARYKSVVRRELQSANEQREIIQKQANRTYYTVRQMIAKGNAPRWACNFTCLEHLCKEWERGREKDDKNKVDRENTETKSEEKKEQSSNPRPFTEEERIERAMEVSAKKIDEEYGEYVAHQNEQARQEPQAGQVRPTERQQEQRVVADKQKKPNPGKGRGK